MWWRVSSKALAALAGVWLAACSSAPARPAASPAHGGPDSHAAAHAAPSGAAAAPAGAAGATSAAPGTAAAGSASAIARPEVPAAARADFDRAVSFMRAGNASEAELSFKQIALQYPQFAAPLVNLAILERKAGQLDEAEASLKSAVTRESGSAVAWTELGATQRMRGEFTAAATSYQQAIAADPRYAPAWRNLGVLSDLYLGDPKRALTAFEEYKELTGEDKPVSGWIAELRQRLGMPPLKRPAATAPEAPAAPGAQPSSQPESPPQSQPQGEAPANAAAPNAAPRAGG